ncbi:resolvase [Finegoldia magna]|uniref:resolvase n=1 Tax=Finegoldia magna TaxID=1260 RepID=UPI0021558B1E|nr:resolvase [Finegoldia magna]MDU3118139.1 resolvase [Finegoldia magna]
MILYIYTKTTEDISIFEDIMEIIHKKDSDICVSAEHMRSFQELEKIKNEMISDDILIIGSLKSLGINEKDIANSLKYFIEKGKCLVVSNIESTYKYGVSQPMNKAILSTILDSVLLNNKNIIELPRNRKFNSGRNKIDFPNNWEELYENWENNNISSKEFLDKSGLKKATFYNMITEYKEILKANEAFVKKYRLG